MLCFIVIREKYTLILEEIKLLEKYSAVADLCPAELRKRPMPPSPTMARLIKKGYMKPIAKLAANCGIKLVIGNEVTDQGLLAMGKFAKDASVAVAAR